MKIDRLLAILSVLLRSGQVTAPELARRFEVSRRTIGRDLDALCQAGFPIVTKQGAGGGISLAEGFILDASVLTRSELESILIGLQGLASVDGAAGLKTLLGKLAGNVESNPPRDLLIDLASHYRDSHPEKISALRTAIAEHRLIAFRYYSERGSKRRIVEPALVLYKWTDWYLSGWCRDRRAFRLFKLRRLWELEVLPETFEPRPLPEETARYDGGLHDAATLTALFEPDVAHLLVESYGPGCYAFQPDGRLLLRRGYTNPAYILRWLLGFGGAVEVLEPKSLREEMARQAAAISSRHPLSE